MKQVICYHFEARIKFWNMQLDTETWRPHGSHLERPLVL